jgi:hypothetical protein
MSEKGALWQAFAQTQWADDLAAFFKDSEDEMKQSICSLTMGGKYDEAKAAAHKLDGIMSVKRYIDECVLELIDELEEKEESKRYRKEIPRHVR